MLLFGHMIEAGERDELDAVWRALADPTRRRLLDLLRDGPRTTGDLCAGVPALSRFAVMKHLGVLESAGLVVVRRRGRERWNHLNAVPLQQVTERWLAPHAARWAESMLRLKAAAEGHDGTREERDEMDRNGTATMETGGVTLRALEIEQEVAIQAPPERVFDALTAEIGNWWSHSFDDAPKAIVLEPRVGGRFHEVWGAEEGALYATVTRLRRPTELRLAGPMGMERPVQGVIAFVLEPADGGRTTRLRLSHQALGDLDEETRQQYDTGWRALLNGRLKSYVESGAPTADA
jgi:uncharacterized protein YndB with AHSA1/START domain/DNA-binding transcriptional ArsR family regulator